MRELEIRNPIEVKAEQFICPVCEIKFYLNEDDVKGQEIGCCLCDVPIVVNTKLFEVQINRIFEK